MDFDPTPYRRDTAAVMAGRIHLNNAGASLMPAPVVKAVFDHLNHEVAMGGYEASDHRQEAIDDAYVHIAKLVGARAHNVAVVENATVAFGLALSAFDFRPGDVILTTRNDYISNQLMYLSLAARHGVRVVRADDLSEGGTDPDSMRRLIREHRPALVAVTWVPTNSGLVQPVHEVGVICEAEGVPYLVDACQAVGQIPIDVMTIRCDYLSATARKFLRGPRGVGFLCVSDRALAQGRCPLLVDMRGAEWVDDDTFRPAPDARRFENWEFAYALLLGLGEAARYAMEVGIEGAGEYAAGLADHARRRLAELEGVRVLDRGAHRCAIVTAEFAGVAAGEIVSRLREQAINTSATMREFAVIDMKEKNASTAVRISPHYYNTRREVDTLIAALVEFTSAA
jgi:selenocysteine lyase/cysteine desulfurase